MLLRMIIRKDSTMNTFWTGLIIAIIAAWFGYSLYRMWRGSTGRDCASCALGADFDYAKYNNKKQPLPKKAEFVMNNGHHIIVDEEAARRRRERIRKMMGNG